MAVSNSIAGQPVKRAVKKPAKHKAAVMTYKLAAKKSTQPKASSIRKLIIADVDGFEEVITLIQGLDDSKRLFQIKEGYPAKFLTYFRSAFKLNQDETKFIFNVSQSTIERRIREEKPLDSVASERLDRIAAVTRLASDVFESQDSALEWLSRENEALGGVKPVLFCDTEIGTNQVRRVLHAIEWGNPV